jgi:hypothetical protein
MTRSALDKYCIWCEEFGEQEQSGLVLQGFSPTIALKEWAASVFENKDEDSRLLVKVRNLQTNELTEWKICKRIEVFYDIRLRINNTVTACLTQSI